MCAVQNTMCKQSLSHTILLPHKEHGKWLTLHPIPIFTNNCGVGASPSVNVFLSYATKSIKSHLGKLTVLKLKNLKTG